MARERKFHASSDPHITDRSSRQRSHADGHDARRMMAASGLFVQAIANCGFLVTRSTLMRVSPARRLFLTQGQLTIDKDLTIDGLGAFYLALGGHSSNSRDLRDHQRQSGIYFRCEDHTWRQLLFRTVVVLGIAAP